MLHFKQLRLIVEENAQKQNAEKEAKEALANSSTALVEKSKDKGKVVLKGPVRKRPSSTLEALHRSAEFKKSLEKLSSEVQAQAAMVQSPVKKQNVQEAIPQVQLQEEIPKPPPQVIQRVEQSEQQILQVEPIQQVDPLPPAILEVQEFHSDLEEENAPSTYVCPVIVSTNMTSSATTTQLSRNDFNSLFPQHSFS